MSWVQHSDPSLLNIYVAVMEQLRSRGVIRSFNNPVADYAENLVARPLGLLLVGQSIAGHDAVDSVGQRYQIKDRRVTEQNQSVQPGALSNLSEQLGDVLGAVIFNPDFSVNCVALILLCVVQGKSKFSVHVNASILHFRRDLLEDPRVSDITPLRLIGCTEASS